MRKLFWANTWAEAVDIALQVAKGTDKPVHVHRTPDDEHKYGIYFSIREKGHLLTINPDGKRVLSEGAKEFLKAMEELWEEADEADRP